MYNSVHENDKIKQNITPSLNLLNLHELYFLSLSLDVAVLLQILQDCPEEPEAIHDEEQFDEIEAVGKSLLDRLTVPVVYPDGYDAWSYTYVFLPVKSSREENMFV